VPKHIGADKHRETRTLAQAFGAELTRLRLAKGWSQQKLADALGYTERYIGQLERGVKSPTLRTVADLAEVFSTKPSVMLKAAERRQDDAENRRTKNSN
jgi:transcriptional regulator with XRE-family HTH domain